MKPAVIIIAVLGFLSLALFFKPSSLPISPITSPSPTQETKPTSSETVKVLATGLEVPWALAFLPDQSLLVTERAGKLKKVKDGKTEVITEISVKQTGESGLHGIAIDPKFLENNFIYLYYTYSANGDNTFNKVSRFIFKDSKLTDEKVIVDKIPGAIFHDGGRIKFGPDGYLYITTGDAQNPSLAQDKNSLAGKILRVTDDKNVEVYSYGHRNPQGITWDNEGKLWELEHGQSATDEINLVEQGKNYGWPIIRGDEKNKEMENPVLHSGSGTWAPAGAAFYEDSIYFGGLRGAALFQYDINAKELKIHLKGQFGRIRDVVLGPDNMLYITTSNRDGRGNPSPDDDKIIRINPEKL
ncbi:MAG: hypothetical protein G01um101493_186 [Microgenomates group bacterium Gr01-1014_93]|nr:MAG: hypothetical protein G01um101493_186 [Microgenomates group bacterium Gr01-1014_93]